MKDNSAIHGGYFILAVTDLLLAIVCAVLGSWYFVYFGVLGFVMWVLGSYFKRTAEKEGE